MNDKLDERTIQRCVDGELNEAEQQAFLFQLEHCPTGWRDLALAFVEHQLWSKAGRDFVHEPAPPLLTAHVAEPPARLNGSGLRNMTLAASTLLAVGLGYLSGNGRFWSSPSSSPGSEIVQAPSNPRGPNAAPTMNVSMDSSQQASASPTRTGPSLNSSASISHQPYDPVPLPSDDQWMPPRLSDELRQSLEDQGFQVREEPRYYTVPVDKNRHLVVPVNTIHVRQQVQ